MRAAVMRGNNVSLEFEDVRIDAPRIGAFLASTGAPSTRGSGRSAPIRTKDEPTSAGALCRLELRGEAAERRLPVGDIPRVAVNL